MYKDKICGIYIILNTLDNNCYIGSSVNIKARFKVHLFLLSNNKHHSIKLQRAWNKYGENNFRFEILEICEPIKDTLLFIEQKYLDLNPKYNCCKLATSTLGFHHSNETKKRLSELRRDPNRKPYKHSDDIKSYLSMVHKNKPKSESHRSKLRKVTLMLDKETEEVLREFKSLGDAGIFLGNYNRRVEIKKVIQGKRKHCYGYKWRFKNDI